MKRFIFHNFALKIIAVGLATVTWIYVNGLIRH